MAIFNSYVKSPEGMGYELDMMVIYGYIWLYDGYMMVNIPKMGHLTNPAIHVYPFRWRLVYPIKSH